ncbi:MAG: killer protein [Gemmatimonas sp.]|nr:killer protein [Gemmatimonas sp.]
MARLDDAKKPEELDQPGLHFHRLKGNRSDTYAVTVRANWRVTWCVDLDGSFIDIDYEDYH